MLSSSQEQVDNGVPIATCLYLFSRWMRKLSEERHVVLMEPGQEYSEEMDLCALATWSGKANNCALGYMISACIRASIHSYTMYKYNM